MAGKMSKIPADSVAASVIHAETAIRDSYPELAERSVEWRDRYQDTARTNIEFYRWLGDDAAELLKDTRYGQNVVDLMAVSAGIGRSTIYKAIQFVTLFTAEQIEEILTRKTSAGTMLTWTHLAELCSVKSSSDRRKLLAMAFSKGLSTRELSAQIKALVKSDTPVSAVMKPATFKGGYARLRSVSGSFIEDCETVLASSIFSTLDSTEDDDLTEEHLEVLDKATSELETIVKSVETSLARLEDQRRRIDLVVASRLTPKVTTDEEESESTVEATEEDTLAKRKPPVAESLAFSGRARRPL